MEILFYIGFALFVLFGPWILLWRVNSRRKNDRLEDQLRWADITGRIQALERELRELRATGTAQVPAQAPKQEVSTPVAAAATPVHAEPAVPPAPPTPSQAAAEAWVTGKTADTPLIVSRPTATQTPISPRRPAEPPVTPPPPSPPTPTFVAEEAGPTIIDRFRSSLDVEEMLGTDWLNKVGIVLVVLGV